MLIIRHGEKPDQGRSLSLPGYERAAAYVPYFINFKTREGQALKIGYLFAAKSDPNSHRPSETIKPLATALHIEPNDKIEDKNYAELANLIRESKGVYDNAALLICWHHEHAFPLAQALGVPKVPPPECSPWPSTWPEAVFGWVLIISYGVDGSIDFARTTCMSTKLMYDDCGQEPPPRE